MRTPNKSNVIFNYFLPNRMRVGWNKSFCTKEINVQFDIKSPGHQEGILLRGDIKKGCRSG